MDNPGDDTGVIITWWPGLPLPHGLRDPLHDARVHGPLDPCLVLARISVCLYQITYRGDSSINGDRRDTDCASVIIRHTSWHGWGLLSYYSPELALRVVVIRDPSKPAGASYHRGKPAIRRGAKSSGEVN